jgi:uncharacterized membrane protein
MKYDPIPRIIALILISIGMAWQMKAFDGSALAKIDTMSAADFIQHQRELHMHSGIFRFFTVLVIGGFFAGALDFISYLISRFLRRGTN